MDLFAAVDGQQDKQRETNKGGDEGDNCEWMEIEHNVKTVSFLRNVFR